MIRRNLSFDNLRSFIIILVVLHHSLLAYTTWGELIEKGPTFNVSPIVDEKVFWGFDLIVSFNDTFFMFLMFFISGLFVWSSIQRKGPSKFMKERFIRLGIPFLIGVPTVITIAYYPSALQIDPINGTSTNLIEHWLDMASIGFGAGPLWFIWVLLLFNLIFILLYKMASGLNITFKKKVPEVLRRSFLSYLLFLPIAISAYFPLTFLMYIIGFPFWIGIGPFILQFNRVFLYFLFFSFGIVIGGYGIHRTFLKKNSDLSRFWWVFLIFGIFPWIIFSLTGLGFTIACVSLVFAITGFFMKVKFKANQISKSLGKNSYGIFILHYLFVIWTQYLFLDIEVPGIFKGISVFIIALILSWGSTIAIRYIPIVRKII